MFQGQFEISGGESQVERENRDPEGFGFGERLTPPQTIRVSVGALWVPPRGVRGKSSPGNQEF